MKGSFHRISLAMTDFFHKIKGRPKFKKKRDGVGSFDTHEGTFIIEKRRIRCEKMGWIRCAKHNIPCGQGITYNKPVIVIEHGQMYFSVGIRYNPPIAVDTPKPQTDIIGIDLGIKTPAVASNGMICKRVDNEKYWKRLRRHRRRLSKHYKTMVDEAMRMKTKFSHVHKSNRTKKLETKVFKLSRKISNRINTNIHQFTSAIVKENPKAIVMETINIPAIIKSMRNAKRALEASMGEIQRQITYKSEWRDIPLIKAPYDFPSTQMCSVCGYIKSNSTGDKMMISDREYICPNCGSHMNRDENSSYVLRDYGYMYLEDPEMANTFYKR